MLLPVCAGELVCTRFVCFWEAGGCKVCQGTELAYGLCDDTFYFSPWPFVIGTPAMEVPVGLQAHVQAGCVCGVNVAHEQVLYDYTQGLHF